MHSIVAYVTAESGYNSVTIQNVSNCRNRRSETST